MVTTERTLTGTLSYRGRRVFFADNTARTGGLTLFNTTRTNEHEKGEVIVSTVRRRDILRTTSRLRGRNFRIIHLVPSRFNYVDTSRVTGTIGSGAVLISVVCVGGRINSVVPIRGVGGVIRVGGTPTLIRVSYIRTFKGIPIYPGGLKTSLLSIATRGVRNPGNYNTLCVGGNIHVIPHIFNNRRRGGVHPNARTTPLVTNFNTTMGTLPSVGGRDTRVTTLGTCTGDGLLRVPNVGFGDNRGTSPCVLGICVPAFVHDRAIIRRLSTRCNICIDGNSTYTGNGGDRILTTVRLPSRATSGDVHVDFSERDATTSYSRLYTTVGSLMGGRPEWV